MADIGDMQRQIAFYQAGGKTEGRDTLSGIDKIFANINTLADKQAMLQKMQLENEFLKKSIEAKMAETEKTKRSILPIASVRELQGKSVISPEDTKTAMEQLFSKEVEETPEQRLQRLGKGIGEATSEARLSQPLTEGEIEAIKSIFQNKIEKVDEPKTLENLQVKKVLSGKISLEDAMRQKKEKPLIDTSMLKAITKAKVELAETRPMVKAVTDEIERVEKLNDNSFGGYFGKLQMQTRSKTNLGTQSERFKNTSDVINTMQAQVAKVLKSTFGGQLSEGERQYLNEVYGALPSLSQTERAIAMKNVKTMLRGRLTASESKLSELSGDAGIEMPEKKPEQNAGNVPKVDGTFNGSRVLKVTEIK